MVYVTAILEIIKLLPQLIDFMKQGYTLYMQAKTEGWISEGIQLTEKIKACKTDQERRDLVKKLVEHSNSIP